MTKSKQSLVTDDRQLSLLELLMKDREERVASIPGRLNISARLAATAKRVIRSAPKSRETIADEMTDLLGETITVSMINNWIADSHPHRIPGEFIPAFCAATGSNEMIEIQAEAAGVFTLPGPDVLRAEIQKLDEQVRKTSAEKRRRILFLQELEGRK